MKRNHMQYFFIAETMSKDDRAMNCSEESNQEIMTQLRLDLVKGNAIGVENALNDGISPDHTLRGDWNLLMYASSLGHSEVVKLLLIKGANPNSSKDNFTPLMTACASRRDEERLLECVRLLIQHGAEINARDRYYVTPLMYAAREGHADIVTYLLNEGANLLLRDERGWTALFWAVNGERKTTTILLLQAESAIYRLGESGIRNETPSPNLKKLQENGHCSNNIKATAKENNPKGIHTAVDTQLCAILKNISDVEANLRCYYTNLDKIRTSLRRLAVMRPSRVWPFTFYQIPRMTRQALCTSERVFQQMRFLHRVAEEVIDSRNVACGDFIVGKRSSPLQAWVTFLLTTTVVTIGLWRLADIPHKTTFFLYSF